MIQVTRLDGSMLTVNAELIEFLEATPDTVVSMTTGRKVVVKEPPAVLMSAVVAYKQRILRGPFIQEEK